MDAAERATNAILKRTEASIAEIYGVALKDAIKSQSKFLAKIADIDSGKIKPPAFYDTPEKILKWRQGYTTELLRKNKVVESITARLKAAGVETQPIIKQAMVDVYDTNRTFTVSQLSTSAGKAGVDVSFAQYDKRQIEILLNDAQPAFSKIAYKSLGQNPAIVRRLQTELAQATTLGESQRDIIKRIRNVTGQSQYQAKRVAQTERTRIQSQGRADTLDEAAAQGVKVTKTWSARMVNTRETHADLDGVTIPNDEAFQLSDGDRLMYPGDPSGAAENTINCHCVLIPGVA